MYSISKPILETVKLFYTLSRLTQDLSVSLSVAFKLPVRLCSMDQKQGSYLSHHSLIILSGLEVVLKEKC